MHPHAAGAPDIALQQSVRTGQMGSFGLKVKGFALGGCPPPPGPFRG